MRCCSLITSKIERQVRAYILDNFCGEQPAGSAFILPVDAKSKDSKAHFSNICWVALSRSLDTLNKDYAYLAAWSALTTVRSHNRKIKERKKRLNVVAIPSVTFKSDTSQDTCRQIALAIKRFLEPPMEPLDKEEAQRHEENVIKPAAMTAEERSKELEGLLWSRELGMNHIFPSLVFKLWIQYRCVQPVPTSVSCVTMQPANNSFFVYMTFKPSQILWFTFRSLLLMHFCDRDSWYLQ